MTTDLELLRISAVSSNEISVTSPSIADSPVEEDEDLVSASAVPAYKGLLESGVEEEKGGKDKFSDAEKRLREELAAFKIK